MHADLRPTPLTLSAHGRRRAADRGFTTGLLARLAAIADREVPVGRGCIALSVSGAALAAAHAEDPDGPLVERLRGRVLVLDPDGVVVTALVASGRAGRRYRQACVDRRHRPARRSGARRG